MSEGMTAEQALEIIDRNIEKRHPYDEELCKAAATLRAAPPRWIPVEERMPQDCASCLIGCTESDVILIAMYRARLWFTFDGNPQPVSDVTHWMPLPEAPCSK